FRSGGGRREARTSVRGGFAPVACALALSGCSARESLSRLDVRTSCAELATAREGNLPTVRNGVVWLVNEPVSDAPLVLNWQQLRIAGQPANIRQYAGRTWLVSGELALSVDWESDVLLEGDWLRCDTRREISM